MGQTRGGSDAVAVPNIAVEPTPTASARASLWLSARLTAGVRPSLRRDFSVLSRKLRIICLVATGILIVAFCGVAPEDELRLFQSDQWTTCSVLAHVALLGALFLYLLGRRAHTDALELWAALRSLEEGGQQERQRSRSVARGLALLVLGRVLGLLEGGIGFLLMFVVLMLGLFVAEDSIVTIAFLIGFLVVFIWTHSRMSWSIARLSVERVLWMLVGGNLLVAVVAGPLAIDDRRAPGTVAHAVRIGQTIQAALAAYAADSVGHTYPPAEHIRDYATLHAFVYSQGGPWSPMAESEEWAGVRFVRYEAHDMDHDGTPEEYVLLLVPLKKPAVTLRLTPRGIEKLHAERRACLAWGRKGEAKMSALFALGPRTLVQGLTIACKRPPRASARSSLRLLAAPEA